MKSKSKNNKIFVCDSCGAEHLKWQGRCASCGQWNTLVGMSQPTETVTATGQIAKAVKPQKISEISEYKQERIKTGIDEFDRTLGGGFVPGSLVLLAGEPGIGKSTLVLQAVAKMKNVLYVSGEESAPQIKMRVARLKIKNPNLLILTDNNIENILKAIADTKPKLVIIDSIQAMQSLDIASAAGSITQVKLSSLKLQQTAKTEKIPIVLTSHVTKEGVVAGPMTLEHLVDAVIYLEGERYGPYRILRAVKNRFGKVSEVGIFEMCQMGLKEVKNPSAVFLQKRLEEVSGSAVSCILEGNRPILVEVQALTERSIYGYPKRTAQGIDLNKLFLLIAVLGKRAKLTLLNKDVYLNIVGGFRVKEPAVDLAACVAIASATLNKAVDRQMVIIGEVGLSGEVKPTVQLEQRVVEAAKLGFKKALVPQTNIRAIKGIKVFKVRSLQRGLNLALLK